MCGCARAAIARASRSKRTRRSGSAFSSAGRILMATVRSRRVSRCLVDLAHAPGTDQAEDFVGAQPRARSQRHCASWRALYAAPWLLCSRLEKGAGVAEDCRTGVAVRPVPLDSDLWQVSRKTDDCRYARRLAEPDGIAPSSWDPGAQIRRGFVRQRDTLGGIASTLASRRTSPPNPTRW